MAENFWSIPDVGSVKTPLGLLNEQASALTDQTNGLLRGRVSKFTYAGELILTLYVSVPALDDYELEVLRYDQPVDMYPGDLRFKSRTYKVGDYEEFERAVKEILSSPEMQRIVGSLLSQAMNA